MGGRVLGARIPRPYLYSSDRRWRARLALATQDPAAGRDLLWLLTASTVGLVLTAVSVGLLGTGLTGLGLAATWARLPATAHVWVDPVRWADSTGAFIGVPPVEVALFAGLFAMVGWWLATPPLMRADARLARALLEPTEKALLAARVRQLAESRAETVDASAAELRRIERDLHDGPQARLVEAHQASDHALAELRDVVRGIHPPVLADRGLAGAVQALAIAQPIPVDVVIDLPDPLPAPVESAAYFAVAEALGNTVRHSDDAAARVELRHDGGRLEIHVADGGIGGADPARGTGLRGIRRRLAAFDGTLTVSSPPGGPTILIMEVPCESSSPRTTPSFATD